MDPDGVAAGERGNDLVDPHGYAVYKRTFEPRMASAMRRWAPGAPLSWSHRVGPSPTARPHEVRDRESAVRRHPATAALVVGFVLSFVAVPPRWSAPRRPRRLTISALRSRPSVPRIPSSQSTHAAGGLDERAKST